MFLSESSGVCKVNLVRYTNRLELLKSQSLSSKETKLNVRSIRLSNWQMLQMYVLSSICKVNQASQLIGCGILTNA